MGKHHIKVKDIITPSLVAYIKNIRNIKIHGKYLTIPHKGLDQMPLMLSLTFGVEVTAYKTIEKKWNNSLT